MRRAKPGERKALLIRHLSANAGPAMSVGEIAKPVDASPVTVSQVLNRLSQEESSGVMKQARGRFTFRPPKDADPAIKARARLRVLEHELKDAAPMATSVMMAERERLEAVANGDGARSAPAMTVEVPAVPVRPISVQPTELPASTPTMFEAVTTHPSGGIILKDENGELWVSYPVAVKLPG